MDGPESPRAPMDAGKADADKAPPRYRDRWWHWLLPLAAIVVPLGVIGGALHFLWQERVAALQAGFPYIAAALGWDAGSAKIHAFGQDGLQVSDLVLGSDGAVVADKVTVSFSPSDLLGRRVQTVQVDGLRLSARLEDGRLVLPHPFSQNTRGADRPLQLPAMPFDIAVLNDVGVNVETPQGQVRLNVNGQVEALEPNATIFDLGIAFDGPTGLRGDLKATGRASNAGADAITLSLTFESEAQGMGITGDGGGSLSATLSRSGDAEAVFALDNIALKHLWQDIEVKGLSGDGTVVLEGGMPVEAAIRLDYRSIEAMGQRLTPGRASLSLDHGAVAVDLLAALPWADLALIAEGQIDDPAVPVEFAIRGNSDFAPLLAAAALPFTGNGEVSFNVTGSVGEPLALANMAQMDPLAWFEQLTLAGEIGLDVNKFVFGDNLTGGAATGRIHVDLVPGTISVEAPDGLALALDKLPLELPEGTVEGLEKALSGPLTLALGGEAGTRPTLRLARDGGGYMLDMETGFHWPELFDGVRGELAASVAVDRQMTIKSFAVPYLLASLDGVAHGEFEGDAEILLSDVEGSPDTFSGQVSLGASSPGGALDGFAVGDLAMETEGPFRFDGTELSFSPSQASRLSVDRVLGPNGIAMRDRVVAMLDGSENKIRLPVGGKPAFDIALAPMAVGLSFGDNAQELKVTLGGVSITGRDGAIEGSLAESQVALPGQPVSITGVVGEAKLDAAGRPTARLNVNSIRHTANPAFVVPLQLEASVEPAGADGLKLDAKLKDASERLSFVLSGTHDRASGNGQALVAMKPLMFLPTVLQPETLFPVLRDRAEAVDGDISLATNLRWADGTLDMPADLSVVLRELTTSEIRIVNSSADIHFSQLYPPATPPGQEIRIGLAEVGVPLSDGRLVFELLANGAVKAQVREMDMFGGLLNSEPFEYARGMDSFTVVLAVNGVQMEQLLAIAKMGEISASGTLHGVIPVTVENGEVAVRGGKLTSGEGGGILQYKPKDIGPALKEAEFSTGLFLQAVENFHYDTVQVTLDEGEAEDLVLGFHLTGNNPDLYAGAPFELNVNLSGPLRELLDRGIKTYKLPDRLRTQIIGVAGG